MQIAAQTQNGVGSTIGFIPDLNIPPFNIGFAVVVTGTVNYTVQHSFDGTNWFSHDDVVNQTANVCGNYVLPVKTFRLTINSGTGSATITMIQAGRAG